MKPHQARHRAGECCAVAAHLLALAIAAAIASACVLYSLGPGFVFLACVVVSLACLLGFFHELAEAARFLRQAYPHPPTTFENHGHE